jgi:hypothetical protein
LENRQKNLEWRVEKKIKKAQLLFLIFFLLIVSHAVEFLGSSRVARFFLIQNTKMEQHNKCPQYIPNYNKIKHMATKYIYQMGIKCIKISCSKGFQNVPKLGFLFENKPSGNPGLSCRRNSIQRACLSLIRRHVIAQTGFNVLSA